MSFVEFRVVEADEHMYGINLAALNSSDSLVSFVTCAVVTRVPLVSAQRGRERERENADSGENQLRYLEHVLRSAE